MSWHSSDGIVTTLWNGKTKNLGSILGMKQEIFFLFPKCLDWLWGPPNLQFKVYVGSLLWEPSGQGVKQYRVVPRLRMSGGIPILPPYAFMVCTWAHFYLSCYFPAPFGFVCYFFHECQVILPKEE